MEWTDSDEPVDEASLREALETVVHTAHQNGVAVERDWPCRTDGDNPNWVVDVVRIVESDSDTDA